MDADSVTELIKNKNISEEGLKYSDEETGEEKLIPRCEEQGKHDYKYTLEQMARRNQLKMDCAKAYPDMDKTMLLWIIDWYMNHPSEAEAYMKKDKKFMRNIVEE